MNETILHSVRVAYENWLYEDRMRHLIRLLEENRGSITQVALFTSVTHSPLTVGELSRRADIMSDRMNLLREAGFSAGINHLPTIGHHCEDLDAGLGDAYTYMTNLDGDVCRGSYCMRNRTFLREYVVPCYEIMAKAKPDFLWIDDDIRYGHMPIGNGCFCDGCIESFCRKCGTEYTRETLRTALRENNPVLRRKWLDHNSDAICGLFEVIAETVYAVDPEITLGFMTGERYFEGYQFARYAEALSAGGTHRIMWRPGGGAYSDVNFDSIVEKQEQIGRQNAYLPDYVTVIQSEIENFPYQLLKKTPRSTAVEAAMSMTVGCTGAAFNILPSETMESLDTVTPHLKAIAAMDGFYKAESELFRGLKPSGIHTGWRIDSQAAVPAGEFASMDGGMYASYAREMFFFGLPQCYHPDYADVTMLTGQSAAVMTDEEIKKILSGGVYLNVSALEYLRSRGFGHLLGFSVGRQIPVDARERYTEHRINEGFVGGIRNCRQAFHGGDSYELIPENDGCETLSELIDYHGRQLCGCTCGIFENALGGRICAAGYYPHDWLSEYQKSVQIRRIHVWLSGGRLPSFVESYHRVWNSTLTGNGKICTVLFNTSNDDLTEVCVAIRTEKEKAVLYTMFEGSTELNAVRTETAEGGHYCCYTIDKIRPYEGVIIAV